MSSLLCTGHGFRKPANDRTGNNALVPGKRGLQSVRGVSCPAVCPSVWLAGPASRGNLRSRSLMDRESSRSHITSRTTAILPRAEGREQVPLRHPASLSSSGRRPTHDYVAGPRGVFLTERKCGIASGRKKVFAPGRVPGLGSCPAGFCALFASPRPLAAACSACSLADAGGRPGNKLAN